jgi:hypothetical protein
MANSPSDRVSMINAATREPTSPLSIVFGAGRSPTKAMA